MKNFGIAIDEIKKGDACIYEYQEGKGMVLRLAIASDTEPETELQPNERPNSPIQGPHITWQRPVIVHLVELHGRQVAAERLAGGIFQVDYVLGVIDRFLPEK